MNTRTGATTSPEEKSQPVSKGAHYNTFMEEQNWWPTVEEMAANKEAPKVEAKPQPKT